MVYEVASLRQARQHQQIHVVYMGRMDRMNSTKYNLCWNKNFSQFSLCLHYVTCNLSFKNFPVQRQLGNSLMPEWLLVCETAHMHWVLKKTVYHDTNVHVFACFSFVNDWTCRRPLTNLGHLQDVFMALDIGYGHQEPWTDEYGGHTPNVPDETSRYDLPNKKNYTNTSIHDGSHITANSQDVRNNHRLRHQGTSGPTPKPLRHVGMGSSFYWVVSAINVNVLNLTILPIPMLPMFPFCISNIWIELD